jgi:hypothetical protein
VSLGLAVWLAVDASADARAAVLVTGLLGAGATAAAFVRPAALTVALPASAAAYALLLTIDDPPLDSRAAGVAAALLVIGELNGWARELAGTTDEPGGAWRRPAWIAGAGAGALALAWIVVAVADVARVEGLAVEAVGALAALAALVLVTRLAGRRAGAPEGRR